MTIPQLSAKRRFQPDRLFRPASVAVIAPDTPSGALALSNLGGFAGELVSTDDAASLGFAPDLVILGDIADAGSTLDTLARMGTFAAVALGRTRNLTHPDVRVLGPGSFGVAATHIRLNATRGHIPVPPGRVALVSQSGALCRAVLDWAGPNGVGFSHIVGLGAAVDLGFAETLDWLSRDPGTGAILLDIRRIENARAFLSAARAAARLRPTVALRPGGRLADPSGLADAALIAGLRRAGILAVDSLADLLAAAETLTRSKPARTDGIAVIANAIGPARLASDAVLRHGIRIVPLTAETRAVLRASLPGLAIPDDPGPLHTDPAEPTRLGELAALLAGAREVGGILAVHAPASADDTAGIEAIAPAAAAIRCPLLTCVLGETTGAAHRLRLAAAGLPVFADPEQAVRGFDQLMRDRRNRIAARELPPRALSSVMPDHRRVHAILADRGRSPTRTEAMEIAGAYGIDVARAQPAASPARAVVVANALGYPVVMRIRPPGDIGPSKRAVFDLRTPAEVVAAARTAPGELMLLQRQLPRAPEMAIRVHTDATFGPVIGCESAGRIAYDLPPLNLTLAHALVAQIGIDVAAAADVLVRVSQLIVDEPAIASVSVAPLFILPTGVVAAGVDMTLRLDGGAKLAIAPYPAELECTYITPSGASLVIRPIRPEDAQAHAEMFARLPAEDIRYRFFSAMRVLSPEQIVRMTQVDYDREMALIAVRPAGVEAAMPATVGVARLVCEPDGLQGEFAVVVQPDMKGQGVGGVLMRRLMEWGQGRGLSRIVGQVLADNAPMLAFVRRLGFALHRIPGDEEVVEAVLELPLGA